MVEMLIALGRANLAAGVAVLLVLGLRKPARARFGARIAYGLWLLPALAAVAACLPARVRMMAAAPMAQALPEPIAPALPAPIMGLPDVGAAISASPATPATFTRAADVATLLTLLWIAGAAVCLVLLLRAQRRFVAESAEGQLGPAVVGVFAPRIVKPRDFDRRFTSDEQRLVLAHENAHLARQDPRINGLVVLIRCLCWFNPLAHVGAYFLRIDQELACDEAVLSDFPGARPLYAKALMKAQLAIRPLPLGCYWPSGTEHPLLERLAMIERDDFSRAKRLAGASVLAGLCAATGLAAWAAQPPQIVTPPPNAVLNASAQQPLVGGSVSTALDPGEQAQTGTPSLTNADTPAPAAYEIVPLTPAEQWRVDAASASYPSDDRITPFGGPPRQEVPLVARMLASYRYQVTPYTIQEYQRTPRGTVIETTTTMTTPDGRTSAPVVLSSVGNGTAFWNDPAFTAAVEYSPVTTADGAILLAPVIAFDTYNAVAIQGLAMSSGESLAIPLPNGSTLNVTASLRPSNEAETARLVAQEAAPPPSSPPPTPPPGTTVRRGVPRDMRYAEWAANQPNGLQ